MADREEEIKKLFSAINNDPVLQASLVPECARKNEKLLEKINKLAIDVCSAEQSLSNLDISIAKEDSKNEILGFKLIEQNKSLHFYKDQCNDAFLKRFTMANALGDKIEKQESAYLELAELFRSAPQLYEPNRLQNEMDILVSKANILQKDLNKIENEIVNLKQGLLLPNNDIDALNTLENMICEMEKHKKLVSVFGDIKKELTLKSEELKQEYHQATVVMKDLFKKINKITP